jgi:hypothetical protein
VYIKKLAGRAFLAIVECVIFWNRCCLIIFLLITMLPAISWHTAGVPFNPTVCTNLAIFAVICDTFTRIQDLRISIAPK